jgi:hypothetical protein
MGMIAMHRRIGRGLLALFIVLAHSRAYAACVEPAQLAHVSASIMRYFDEAERDAAPGLSGIQGTGWFLSPTEVVTAEHVATAMKLSTQHWKEIEIADADGPRLIFFARVRHLAGAQTAKLAVLELQTAVSGVRIIAIRSAPLAPEEEVVTFAYPAGRPRVVGGRFKQFGDGGRLAGTALLEMYDGNNRLAVDHGASGAPVLDCEGRVAAVVSDVFTQSLSFSSREFRISTPWGTPNVVSVPIQALEDLHTAD